MYGPRTPNRERDHCDIPVEGVSVTNKKIIVSQVTGFRDLPQEENKTQVGETTLNLKGIISCPTKISLASTRHPLVENTVSLISLGLNGDGIGTGTTLGSSNDGSGGPESMNCPQTL